MQTEDFSSSVTMTKCCFIQSLLSSKSFFYGPQTLVVKRNPLSVAVHIHFKQFIQSQVCFLLPCGSAGQVRKRLFKQARSVDLTPAGNGCMSIRGHMLISDSRQILERTKLSECSLEKKRERDTHSTLYFISLCASQPLKLMNPKTNSLQLLCLQGRKNWKIFPKCCSI